MEQFSSWQVPCFLEETYFWPDPLGHAFCRFYMHLATPMRTFQHPASWVCLSRVSTMLRLNLLIDTKFDHPACTVIIVGDNMCWLSIAMITIFCLREFIYSIVCTQSRSCVTQLCVAADIRLSFSAPETQDVWPMGQACFKLVDIVLVTFVSSPRRGKKPLQRI